MNTAEHVARLATSWVFHYTQRLPPKTAEVRRAELASDLWEQRHDAQENGVSNLSLTVALGWRVVAGMPADLSWRFTRRMAAQGGAVDHRAVRGEAAMTLGQAGGAWVRRRRRTRKCVACGQRYARKLPYCPICKTGPGGGGIPEWAGIGGLGG